MNSYFRRRPCGCGTFRPWRCYVPRHSTPFSSRSRGFSYGEIEHVLPTNNKTGSLNLNTTNSNMPDDFFLRPFLTREEYSYWYSHFGGLSSSYACSSSSSCTCALNAKDNTTVTYQHMKASVCSRNATGKPCTKHLLGDRPVLRTKSTSDGYSTNTGLVTEPSVPENVESAASCGKMEAHTLGCYYSVNKGANMKSPSGCTLKDKGAIERPSPDERSIMPPHQTGSSRFKGVSNNGNLTKGCGVHQALSPELRRRLSERYLCGDKSFEENPATSSLPTRYESIKTGATDLCDPRNTSVSNLEPVAADACSVKRKSTSGSENVRYPKINSKVPRVRDDEEGTTKAQTPNETIDLNDTLTSFLNGPLARSICRGKNASFKIDESRGIRRSRGMKRSRGVAKRCVQGRPGGKKSTTITTDDRCEINNAKKANYEHEVETHNITQPKIVSTFSLADIKVKSGDGDQALNDRNKPCERKNIGDVINAEKPVQRGLLKNTKSSLCGSYALDYETLPKLISVLSSPVAKVVSNLKT